VVGVYLVEDTVGLIALGKAALVKECIQGFLRLRLRAVQSLVRAVAVLADAQHGLQTAVLGLIALGQCVDLVLHLGDFLVRFDRRQPGTIAAGPSRLVHDALARGLPELIVAKHAIVVGVYLVEDTVGLIALGKAALVKECIQGFLRLRLRAVQSLVRAVAVLADA